MLASLLYVVLWPGVKGFYLQEIESEISHVNHLKKIELDMTSDLIPYKYQTTFIKSEIENRMACLIKEQPDSCVNMCNTLVSKKIDGKSYYDKGDKWHCYDQYKVKLDYKSNILKCD